MNPEILAENPHEPEKVSSGGFAMELGERDVECFLRDGFDEGRQAQLKKVWDWGTDPCLEHGHRNNPIPRFECSVCLHELSKLAGVEE